MKHVVQPMRCGVPPVLGVAFLGMVGLRSRRPHPLAGACLVACAFLPSVASGKTFTDYFKPTPVACAPTSSTWGDKAILPRDTCNGLEDPTATATVKAKWMYWDGKILRDTDGTYHMYADRWPHANGMGDWVNSETVHATSNTLLGPYVDQGYAFGDGPDSKNPHKGHNVTASELPDGTYCLIVDEIVPFTIFTARTVAAATLGRAARIPLLRGSAVRVVALAGASVEPRGATAAPLTTPADVPARSAATSDQGRGDDGKEPRARCSCSHSCYVGDVPRGLAAMSTEQ
jgi:hypothetical protein